MSNDNYKSNHCWYCGKIVENDKYNKQISLYKVVSRHDSALKSEVKYQRIKVKITRCQDCYKSDMIENIISMIVLACVIIGTIVILLYTEGNLWWVTVLSAFALLVLYARILNMFYNRKAKKTGIKISVEGHPIIEALKAEGWSLNKPQA